jgi:hypothetical protein
MNIVNRFIQPPGEMMTYGLPQKWPFPSGARTHSGPDHHDSLGDNIVFEKQIHMTKR